MANGGNSFIVYEIAYLLAVYMLSEFTFTQKQLELCGVIHNMMSLSCLPLLTSSSTKKLESPARMTIMCFTVSTPGYASRAGMPSVTNDWSAACSNDDVLLAAKNGF